MSSLAQKQMKAQDLAASQVQAALSELAEAQLALMSSSMPQHIIQVGTRVHGTFLSLRLCGAYIVQWVSQLLTAPHNALAPLQFLALQSTAAVPANTASLARRHKGVTLLFMDIVGFTGAQAD